MRSFLLSLGILFACASNAVHAADTAAPAMRYDHFNPVALNEFALQKVRDGDVGSALILLERANLLAPHDARIRRNLDMLRAQRDGKPFVAPAAADTALAQEKSGSDAPATLAKHDSSMEPLPVAPIWRKPGR